MIDDIAGVANCQEKSVILNSIINAKIEAKKLQFNFKKCVNMHVGPNKQNCSKLKVHDKQMMQTEKQKYLGDLVSCLGSNEENVKERCKIGYTAISQIKSLIKEVSMGKFTVQIGLILRDSIFVSKVLLNTDVWHCVKKTEIENLEVIDRMLLRHVLDAHSKTGLEWIYSDTGKLNLKSLVQIRRLMYLWHVLSRDESELIKRIYETQKITSNAGDWFKLVEADKLELGITLTDEEIQGISKNVFKTFVKKRVKSNHLKYLNHKCTLKPSFCLALRSSRQIISKRTGSLL